MPSRVIPAPVLNALPVAAYTCDPAGRIADYNPPAVELWGRSPRRNDPADVFCGSHRLFTPDGTPVPHDRCWMALALAEGRAFHGRPIRIGRPDGQVREAVAFASPLYGPDGGLVGGLNLLLDVTADRQAEADILRAVAELRARERARTAALMTVVLDVQQALTAGRGAPGLVPLCSHCKAVRDAAGRWHPIEQHLTDRTGDALTHGICPDCLRAHYAGLLEPRPAAAG